MHDKVWHQNDKTQFINTLKFAPNSAEIAA